MPAELVKSPYKVCRIIGENVFSSVVEDDINVPDVNPDVYKILEPRAIILVKDCEVLTDKVLVNGQVLINVLYTADVEGRPLSSIDIPFNFSQSIDIPGVKPRMKESINAVVQHIDCSMINSRKLNVKAIIDLKCRVEEIFEFSMPSDIRGLNDVQILREQCSFKQLVGYNRDQYEISDKLILEEDIPEVSRVLRTDFRNIIKEDKTVDGKVEVNGVLGINVLYTSLDENNTINYIEREIPYTQYIEIPEADRSMECVTDAAFSQLYLDVEENEAGARRKLGFNSILNVSAKVFRHVAEDVISDAYSPTNIINISREQVDMNEFVGKGHSNTVVKESMSINNGDPEIERVYSVNVVPVINEARIMDDKVVMEGILDCSAIYMTSYSAEPMCSLHEQIPFRHYVDIANARLGMYNSIKCGIDNISFSLMNSTMIELRVVLNANAEVWKQSGKKIVYNIQESEGINIDPNRIPAVTIYIVQKGDSLWSIAKRYNTTVDSLVKMNDIENPSKIQPGMQIMILKSVRVG